MTPTLEHKPALSSNGAQAGPVNSANSGGSHEHEKKIKRLIEQIEAFPDETARDLLHECLQSVLALYGEGLGRVMQLIKNAGADGEQVHGALIHDKLVRSLLLIHGLHPQSLEERLQEALGKIRPYLESHGGNVELLGLENDVAKLRLQGTCKTCPSSTITLELAVRQAIEVACPDLLGFEVEGIVPPIESATPLVCDEKILAK
ncbi:MAG: NifU family protein [Verrucomicrobiota bacterium]